MTFLLKFIPLFAPEADVQVAHIPSAPFPWSQEVKKALKPNTAVIYLESPANPTIAISDITEIAKLAKNVGALV